MDALTEIHRVLKPHGVLGLVWNVEDYNAPRDHEAPTPWEAVAHDLTWSVADESGDEVPRFRHLQWRKVFDEQVKKTPLSLIIASDDQKFSLPIGEHIEPFEVALSEEQAWDRYRTLGHIAVLEGDRLEVSDHPPLCDTVLITRQRTKKTFMDAISGPDVEKNAEGKVIVHGKTYAVWSSKIPAAGREGLTNVEHSKA